jgi:uncharacterized membrane protein
MSPSLRRLLVLGGLVLVSAFDVSLVGLRVAVSGSSMYSFLVWNLFLAWAPVAFALWLYDGYRKDGLRPVAAVPAVGWLLFFPNAPYIVTDLVHLDQLSMPLWYDGGLIAAFAVTGLMLGFVSLALVHAVVEQERGRAAAWSTAGVAIVLASVGVYVGRVLNLNSWDAVVRPLHLASSLGGSLGDPHLFELTVLYSGFLALCYLLVWPLVQPLVELGQRQ